LLRTNTNFDTYNLDNSKPVVIIHIAGMDYKYTTGPFSGIDSNYKQHLIDVEILCGSVDMNMFQTSPFGIDCSVANINDTVMSDLYGFDITGSRATIKIGFQELAITDFIELPTCQVVSWDNSNSLKTKFVLRHFVYTEFKRKVFRSLSKCTLTVDVNSSATTLTVASGTNSNFHTSDGAIWGRTTYTYLKIDNEIMRYTAKSSTTFTVTRGQLGSTAASHTAGAEIKEIYYVYDTPIEFLIQVLTGYNNTDGAPEDFNQALPSGFGLDLDVDNDIDEIQMFNEHVKWEQTPATINWKYKWIIDDEKDANSFIVEQVLKLLPGFFIYTENSKLGIKIFDLRLYHEDAFCGEIDNETFDSKLKVDRESYWNKISVGEDYLPGTRIWGNTVQKYTNEIDDGNEITIRPEIISFPVTFFTDDETWLRYFRNIACPHFYVDFGTFLKYWVYQIGDVINFTDDKLYNYGDNFQGWSNETIQILSKKIHINTNRSYCEFSGINFDHVTRVANYLDTEVANESTIDSHGRSAMYYDTSDTVSLGANDSYYDVQTLVSNVGTTIVRVTIEADLPGGTDSEEFVGFSIWGIETGVGSYNDKKWVYYNASHGGKFRQELVLYIDSNSYNLDRIKVDYFDRSAGVGDRLSNVNLIQVAIMKHSITINESV